MKRKVFNQLRISILKKKQFLECTKNCFLLSSLKSKFKMSINILSLSLSSIQFVRRGVSCDLM